ncbi:MAG TPA: energy transducer TonB [Falsiroseomonas sp.]|nr:energy transducer TonB [Falsiroseomonas sp.]
MASRRGAFGASLALHGTVAAAAILPFLRAEPIRPAMPGGVEVMWAAPASPAAPAPGLEEPAEAVETVAAVPPPPALAADASPPPAPVPAAAAPEPAEPVPMPEPAIAEPPVPIPTAEPAPPPAAIAATEPDPPPAALPMPPPPAPPVPAAMREPPRRQVARAEPARPSLPSAEAATGATAGPAAPAAERTLPAAAPDGPVLVTAPRYRRPPAPPAYPPRAVEFGLTGTVLVRARVGPDGSTAETRLWRSSGHPLLDAAAIAAVRRWAFEPASVDGRRVEAWVEVPVHFRLN